MPQTETIPEGKRAGSSIREVEETVARISSHKGVEGVMIMNRHGAFFVNCICNNVAIGTFAEQ